jgi:hypothetical protein
MQSPASAAHNFQNLSIPGAGPGRICSQCGTREGSEEAQLPCGERLRHPLPPISDYEPLE